jgi:hypothetical protein
MEKELVFISHPIGGDVAGNVAKVLEICKRVHLEEDVIPVAPYLTSLQYLDDSNPEQRRLGMEVNLAYLRNHVVRELRAYGDRISEGMWQEIRVAGEEKIPVILETPEVRRDWIEPSNVPCLGLL